MKILRLMLCAVVLVALASCGGSKYDAAKAKDLCEKIEKATPEAPLSDEDVAAIIDQCEAMYTVAADKAKEVDFDQAKYEEWEATPEAKDMFGYDKTFERYLATAKLSEENQKKLEAARENVKKLAEEIQKGFEEKAKK